MNKHSKPALILLLLVAALDLAAAGTSPPRTLRETAARIGLLVGTAVNPAHLSEPEYAATLAREYNMVEPENAMKWTATEPERDRFDFASGDQIVAFAEAHDMKVRGHNLLWGIYNPAWLTSGHFTPRQLRGFMKKHILTVVHHYRGKVFAWDVVNEAIGTDGSVKHSIWYDRPGIGLRGRGTDYVAQAFRWAHQADPHALLFYNDYDAEGLNAKSDAIYAMAKDFRRRGVPIDGIGLQMHIGLNTVPKGIAANIKRLAALGLQVHISEMDVKLPITPSGELANPADLERQAQVYAHVASVCASQPACTAFQTWGFTDKYTWITHFTHGKDGQPLPFDANYRPKPAFQALLEAFSGAAPIRRPNTLK